MWQCSTATLQWELHMDSALPRSIDQTATVLITTHLSTVKDIQFKTTRVHKVGLNESKSPYTKTSGVTHFLQIKQQSLYK